MTTLAMGAGMMPIVGAGRGGRQLSLALGVAVIGGLITSTFLSLLVIPAVFTGVDDLGLKFGELWRRA